MRLRLLAALSLLAAAAARGVDVRGVQTFGVAHKGMQLGAQETALFNRSGAGAGSVTSMWFTGDLDWAAFGLTRVRVYVDGETDPSVSFQLLMAVGVGFNEPVLKPWGESLMGATALQGGIYLSFRIPFEQSVLVTAQAEDDGSGATHGFYFILRGLTNFPVSLGQLDLPATGTRLRLQRLESVLVQPQQEVAIYNSSAGSGGALLLVTLAGNSSNLHYLEGVVRAYVDGQEILLSSGTEDFFFSGQYFDLGTFHTPVSGCTVLSREAPHRFSAYKFLAEDPVVWSKQLVLTWTVGDDLHPDTAPTTLTSYVWAYEWPS